MENNKYYKLTLTEEQLSLVKQCVSDCASVLGGDLGMKNTLAGMDTMTTDPKWLNRATVLRGTLREIVPAVSKGSHRLTHLNSLLQNYCGELEMVVDKEALQEIMWCVEDCDRFTAGQLELWNTLSRESLREFDDLRKTLRETERNLYGNESLGYDSTVRLGNLYQIWRSIMHFLTIEAGISNVYTSETLPSGNQGKIGIDCIEILD